MDVVNADLDEFRTLVRAAFEQAQRSGKPDWDEMTSAVLKNRLLQMTGNNFTQERYGSPSFVHLVRRIPDLLTVITDKPPFRLRLVQVPSGREDVPGKSEKAPSLSDLSDHDLQKSRIREDLWRAIIDYASGNKYVLDPDTGLARPRRDNDPAAPTLPTASRDEVASWRHEFIDTLESPSEAKFSNALSTWADGRGKQSALPSSVRGSWAKYLKKKVIEILLAWFDDHHMRPPEDLIASRAERGTPLSDPIGDLVETRYLRDMIIRAVRVMTHEELSQVSLPAGILFRVAQPERNLRS